MTHPQSPDSEREEFEAITFDRFVEYGKAAGGNIVNGMPWSFQYKGHAISHENDRCYLVCLKEAPHTLRFTPDDLLVYRGGKFTLMKLGPLRQWAALREEDTSPWAAGYDAARSYVAMQLSRPASPAVGKVGEPAAWRYTMWFDDECVRELTSSDRLQFPFGRAGIDFSDSATVEEEPLFTSPPPEGPAVAAQEPTEESIGNIRNSIAERTGFYMSQDDIRSILACYLDFAPLAGIPQGGEENAS